jgi:hypothetical protein
MTIKTINELLTEGIEENFNELMKEIDQKETESCIKEIEKKLAEARKKHKIEKNKKILEKFEVETCDTEINNSQNLTDYQLAVNFRKKINTDGKEAKQILDSSSRIEKLKRIAEEYDSKSRSE